MIIEQQIDHTTIRLTRGDVIVDSIDVDNFALNQYRWTIVDKNGKLYASAKVRIKEMYKNITLHRLLMGFPSVGHVDHIDRNTLNNRRKNLRVLTPQQNWVNSAPRKNGKIKYKGVSLHALTGKYRATIQINRCWKHLGLFETAEEAAKVYDAAVFSVYGDIAYLNRSEFSL